MRPRTLACAMRVRAMSTFTNLPSGAATTLPTQQPWESEVEFLRSNLIWRCLVVLSSSHRRLTSARCHIREQCTGNFV